MSTETGVILETERLVVREWTPEDEGALFEMCSVPEVMRYIGDGRAWTERGRARAWLERAMAGYRANGYGRWAVVEKATGRVVGSCGYSLLANPPEIDFGYVFERASWGKGYATEAARACLRHGFERLGFVEVTANTAPENHPSRRVLEKVGFEYRGLRLFEGDEEPSSFYVARSPRARRRTP